MAGLVTINALYANKKGGPVNHIANLISNV